MFQALVTESFPQSCIALLMIMTVMSCQRTERSANSSQGWRGLMPLVSACSCRISSSSLLWTSQPRSRLRADRKKHNLDEEFFVSVILCLKSIMLYASYRFQCAELTIVVQWHTCIAVYEYCIQTPIQVKIQYILIKCTQRTNEYSEANFKGQFHQFYTFCVYRPEKRIIKLHTLHAVMSGCSLTDYMQLPLKPQRTFYYFLHICSCTHQDLYTENNV